MITKKYLIYENIVRGAGLGHTLSSYNYALNMAMNQKLRLIVPKTKLGHGLGNEFQFEVFFGLDKYSEQHVNDIITNHGPELVRQEYFPVNNPCSGNFNETKIFFHTKYMQSNKVNKYRSHIIKNKINIAVHIRRGDIVKNKSILSLHKDRILPDQWFRQSLIKTMDLKGYNAENVNVNIYSELQGDGLYYNENSEPVDLKKVFNIDNCNFYLSVNMYECLYNMIEADIFIGGRNHGIPMLASLYRELFSRESFLDASNERFIKQNNFTSSKIIE